MASLRCALPDRKVSLHHEESADLIRAGALLVLAIPMGKTFGSRKLLIPSGRAATWIAAPSSVPAPMAPGESRHFLSRNRGKHVLPLDLRNPKAQRVIDALLVCN